MKEIEIIIIYNNLSKKLSNYKMKNNKKDDKLFFLNKKQIIKFKKVYLFFVVILTILSINDINYNINNYEWFHISLIIVFPPYIILYFILRLLKIINNK